MEDRAQNQMRMDARGRRVPPGRSTSVVLTPQSNGLFPESLGEGALELRIEATSADGELAGWYVDQWWTEVISHLASRDATVHFLPSPGAITHPVIHHHAAMLRRVVPHWRVVAYGFRNDALTSDDIRCLARSLFHELRFYDARRAPLIGTDRQLLDQSMEDLFAGIQAHPIGTRIVTSDPGA